MSQYSDLICQYEDMTALENALQGVSAELMDRVPAPGKWTIRQLVAHVADSELVGATRIRWIAAQPQSVLKAYDQELWEQRLHYPQLDPQLALQLVRSVRQWTGAMLRTLPESAWTQKGIHEERGELTLAELLKLYVGHTENHARQISSIRANSVAAA